ncbi:MAG: GGDEF domain-containing protein [Gammaproteobacteria bacterium]|nr:MAG: GGDEF domain-containing protein [Gammaproteobacteria bacterium]
MRHKEHAPIHGERAVPSSTMSTPSLDSTDPSHAAVAEKLPPAKLPRQLSDAEYDLFNAAGRQRTVSPGETIFRKGELGRSMFVIESGEIHLEFGDGLPHKILGVREFLGELALFIGDHMRVASAIATAQTQLRVIDHVAFEDLLARQPLLLAQFMRRSFAYLVASEQQLIAYLRRRNEDLLSTLHSLRQTQHQLSNANNLIRTDELTGLANRRGLYQFLEGLGERRADACMALFLIDLDRFKRINDQFGHLLGDRVLCVVADELRANMGEGDLCCRLGGDEFALLVQLSHRDELDARAARIVGTMRGHRLPEPHHALQLSVSVGASLCDTGANWSTWYSDADRALYAAKSEGGDGWRLSA